MRQNLWSKILFVVGVGLLIFNIGWAWKNSKETASSDVAGTSDQYPLLAKRIFVDNPNDIFINFVPLRKKLETRLAEINAPKSFYFEYLPDGTSIRIGDDNELVAASLTKLPFVMDLYRAAELGRINLDDSVTLQPDWIDQRTGTLWERGAGAKVSYREAAKLALTESDNTAIVVVRLASSKLVKPEEESLAQVDIELQRTSEDLLLVSAKSFSSLLKCLYFACYLTRDNSQEILSHLTQSIFDDRITRFLPKDIVVAHKIANFARVLSTSDCGIIYIPKRPYILCVMTGLPEQEANALISTVSKEIYDYINGLEL